MILCAACLLFAAAASAAQTPRLALWITETIDPTEGGRCVQLQTTEAAISTAPTLTDNDIVLWDEKTYEWFVDPAKFDVSAMYGWLHHCYALALDGVVVSRGIMRSRFDAALSAMPALHLRRRTTPQAEHLTLRQVDRHDGRERWSQSDVDIGHILREAIRR